MIVPAVAVKVAVVDPAATTADAGTVKFALLLASVITVAPDAALLRVMVQELVPLEPRLVGVQASEERASADARFSTTLCDRPLSVAVTVAV